MSGSWRFFFFFLVLAPVVSTPGCGPGQVSEESAVESDADLENVDDGGIDAAGDRDVNE